MDDLEVRLEQMLASREEVDPDLIQAIMALPPGDPATDRILARLMEFVGDQPASPVMNIEDYYVPGDELFTLQWPLAPQTLAVLVMPFDALDRKTQFYVLFQEWTRRDLEANTARNTGDLDAAKTGFEECLARAEQLDVAELRARSYEGLGSVLDMQGDRKRSREMLEAAIAAREE
jgi:hypothetical protein